MVLRGFASLKRLDVEQYAEISFEDLQSEPKRVLEQMGLPIDVIPLASKVGKLAGRSAPAHALAVLASEVTGP